MVQTINSDTRLITYFGPVGLALPSGSTAAAAANAGLAAMAAGEAGAAAAGAAAAEIIICNANITCAGLNMLLCKGI